MTIVISSAKCFYQICIWLFLCNFNNKSYVWILRSYEKLPTRVSDNYFGNNVWWCKMSHLKQRWFYSIKYNFDSYLSGSIVDIKFLSLIINFYNLSPHKPPQKNIFLPDRYRILKNTNSSNSNLGYTAPNLKDRIKDLEDCGAQLNLVWQFHAM